MTSVIRRIGLAAAAMVIALTAPAARAGEKLIDGAVTVTKVPKGHEIAFTVTTPTDVTVRILDAEGQVVRNLACGVVGRAKAAKPLAGRGLAQKVLWDGKDDAGKDVAAAGCKVSVAAGMRARFDKFILGQPDGCDTTRKDMIRIMKGLGDEYLVTQHWGVHLTTTRVFNSEGKFVRQIWPPSVNKPKDKLARLISNPRVGGDDWQGRRVPMCVNHNSTYYFGSAWPILAAPDGSVIGIHGYVSDYLGIWVLGPDGFPAKWAWYPPWQPRKQSVFTKNLWKVAAGPAGDVYLADGLHHVVGHFKLPDMTAMATFTHSGTEKLPRPRAYIGVVEVSYGRGRKNTRGKANDESHFAGPDDIAVDRKGNLWVLDGDRVKVYAADGKFLRFEAKAKFPRRPAIPNAVTAARGNPRALCFPHMLRVDSKGRLYVKNHGVGKPFIASDVEGKTFSVPKVTPYGWRSSQGYSCVDAQNNWYVAALKGKEPARIVKFSPSGKKLSFGGSAELLMAPDLDIKGVHVAPGGDIYVVVTTNKWKATREVTKSVKFGDLAARGKNTHQTWVNVYSPDGRLKQERLVRSVGINDVAVDRQGSVYVIDGTMWHGAQMMVTSKGRVTGGKKAWPFAYLTPQQARLDPKTQWNKRFSLLSRLVKFSPEGGAIDGVDGAAQLWGYAGVSGVSPWNCGNECPGAQICLDPAGRLWVPDTFMYEIKAIDRAGNLIARVGAYGNADCKGGGGDRKLEGTSVVVDPEIPLSRPAGIAVWKDFLFISDMMTHRVMRCRLDYADTQQAEVK